MRNFLIFLLLTIATNAHALDFKGIELGAPTTKEEVVSKIGLSCGPGTNHLLICTGYSTIAGARAFINLVVGKSGNVSRILIDFKESSYAEVARAIQKKFGPPIETENDILQNAMGAKFKQEKMIWMEGENHVVLRRYAGNITDSSIYMSTEEDRAMMREFNEKAAGDL